jgi:malonyl-CoA O-methyltransferase
MPSPSVAAALPDRRAARAAFDRAATTFGGASVVHDWSRQRLLERLDFLTVAPEIVADLGSATGQGAAALAARFSQARVIAVDTSMAMLRATAAVSDRGYQQLAADAERLPLAADSTDLVLANLLLPWCWPPAVFAEVARVLSPTGLLVFATLGPDTLQEVRNAWSGVDDHIHVHAAFDMHDLGDMVAAAGLGDPVIDTDRVTLTYRDIDDLLHDLRACGSVNTAPGRRKSLTGPARWHTFGERLRAGTQGGRFAITIELIFGHAWGGQAPREEPLDREIAVPVAQVLRRRP